MRSLVSVLGEGGFEMLLPVYRSSGAAPARGKACLVDAPEPRYVALIAHGIAEHARRYDHVAAALLAELARAEHPGLPLVLIGHSLGGIIATRYAQRYMTELTALILSAPVIGGNPAFEPLLEMDPIPDVPLDPAMLSRDPTVGEAYAADELVYHGPLQRLTLETIFGAGPIIARGPTLDLPTLWMHGENDPLARLQ